ncbi:MAG: hypothetical protein M3542_11995 [Acidobacteriota bacterium]|nr:hypothetical protein [Acidobacteriota bacterium]MDQ5872493.1 hypothetical protein [Acidobacteriota bacterium]
MQRQDGQRGEHCARVEDEPPPRANAPNKEEDRQERGGDDEQGSWAGRRRREASRLREEPAGLDESFVAAVEIRRDVERQRRDGEDVVKCPAPRGDQARSRGLARRDRAEKRSDDRPPEAAVRKTREEDECSSRRESAIDRESPAPARRGESPSGDGERDRDRVLFQVNGDETIDYEQENHPDDQVDDAPERRCRVGPRSTETRAAQDLGGPGENHREHEEARGSHPAEPDAELDAQDCDRDENEQEHLPRPRELEAGLRKPSLDRREGRLVDCAGLSPLSSSAAHLLDALGRGPRRFHRSAWMRRVARMSTTIAATLQTAAPR